ILSEMMIMTAMSNIGNTIEFTYPQLTCPEAVRTILEYILLFCVRGEHIIECE
ncbi:17937_t:CDS:1, partial [Acaulospora morrowiae]